MERRKFLTAVAGSGSLAAIAGCFEEKEEENTCEGDCGLVDEINVDSYSGWGDTYTNFYITLYESFTGEVKVETFDDGEINGFKKKEVENQERVAIEFDNYKTGHLGEAEYKLYITQE